jgi:hypothetical protein
VDVERPVALVVIADHQVGAAVAVEVARVPREAEQPWERGVGEDVAAGRRLDIDESGLARGAHDQPHPSPLLELAAERLEEVRVGQQHVGSPVAVEIGAVIARGLAELASLVPVVDVIEAGELDLRR